MDWRMPGMDGYTACRKIREQERFKDLPVIAMTANAMAGDREKVLAAGMNDHIAKPIRVHEMFNTLAKWITPSVPATHPPATSSEERPTASPDCFELPGIDSRAGLATAQGNKRLYRKLLRKFRSNQGDFEPRFRIALEAGNLDQATLLAHTLKGVAGNIGALKIQHSAQVLETACKNAEPNIERPLAAVMAELRPLIQALQTHETETMTDTAEAAAKFDLDEVKPLPQELRQLVANNDTKAADVLENLPPLFQGTEYSEDLIGIARAIEAYDFDTALNTLKELAEKLDIYP